MNHFFRCIFLVSVTAFLSLEFSAQLFDDFSDGDFNVNPSWTGDTGNFIVNGVNQLQLNDDEASQSYLSVPLPENSLNDKEWRFWIKQSFSGSANNHSRIYLSSQIDLLEYIGSSTIGAQGYFIQLGESGSSDAIRLFKDGDTPDTPIEITSGTEGLVASSFEISIRVLRDEQGNWEIYIDQDGGENYSLEASGFDDSYNTGNYLGMVCNYTVSNADNFYFDNIYFGDVIVDTQAPEIVSVTATSSNTIELLFNEPVEELSAENPGNYTVLPFLNPSAAIRDDDNQALVLLQFSSDFDENTNLTLQVESVFDLEGNVIATISEDFIWFVAPTAQNRDLVFNEVFADPTPSVGLPEGEYVEIYNASDEIFDLENWEFVNSTTSKVLPSFTLLPGAYVILCDDEFTSQYQAYGDVIEIASFTALANTEDSLSLIDNNGVLIDYVVYSNNWYNDPEKEEGGWSLEQINPLLSCSGANNWSASQDDEGGSPGHENSIINESPDTDPPSLQSVLLIESNVINILFNEALDEASISLANFELTDGFDVESLNPSPDLTSILLTTDLPFEPNITYILSIQSLSDCEGNEISESITIEFIFGEEPLVGDVIINEILAAPSSDMTSPNAEFVELFNKSNKLLDLSSITLSGGFFIDQVLLEPNQYLIITHPDDIITFLPYPGTEVMQSFPGLTNSGRELELLNSSEEQLDYLSYADDWYGDSSKDDGGWSLELINPNDPCSDQNNWAASTASIGATPGTQNSIHNESPDAMAPLLELVYTIDNQSIELQFNEQINISTIGLDDVTILSQSGIPAEFNPIEIQESESFNSLVIIFDTEIPIGEIWQVSIEGLADCWGNIAELSSGHFAVPEASQAGDLIINEVLFNPKDDGVDFVEIYNNSSKNISLQDWNLANLDDGIMDNLKSITDIEFILFPGDYLFLSTDPVIVANQYPFTQEARALKMESLPSFNNDEGTVFLIQNTGEVSDRFDYREELHFGLLDETDGVSLERLDFNRSSLENSNWHSAAESQGYATPGYTNSQMNTASLSEDELSISPEVFSPDNDGYEDVVNISYHFDEPGYVANITIFDSDGREIRQLVRNELLGTSGTFSWDGIKENNELANIGIYLIYFEIFDLEGNVKGIKDTCVLGHKL